MGTQPIRSADPLYPVVTKALGECTEPQTYAMLMDRFDVRQAACARFGEDVKVATFKLSDLLGFMWRRGLLDRYPAPSQSTGSLARFAYSMKQPRAAQDSAPIPFSPLATARAKLQDRPTFSVQETEEGVKIEFEHFSVVIRPKP